MKRNLWQDNISRAALSPTPQGMFFWGETMGMWLKWGQRLKTRLMSAASAAIAWQPHRDQAGSQGLQKSRLGRVREQIFGTEEEKTSAGGVCGIIFLGMLLAGRMLGC